MHQDDLKENDEFVLFFKIDLGKIDNGARNLINSSPPPLTEATTFAFSSVVSFFYVYSTKYEYMYSIHVSEPPELKF